MKIIYVTSAMSTGMIYSKENITTTDIPKDKVLWHSSSSRFICQQLYTLTDLHLGLKTLQSIQNG